jgi:hypothetical protein
MKVEEKGQEEPDKGETESEPEKSHQIRQVNGIPGNQVRTFDHQGIHLDTKCHHTLGT